MWDLLEKYSGESEALTLGEFLIWCASQNFENLDMWSSK
jgi:hypothetical protein